MKELTVKELVEISGGNQFWGNVYIGAVGGAGTGAGMCKLGGPKGMIICGAAGAVIGGGIAAWLST